jgi:hypothetical protein
MYPYERKEIHDAYGWLFTREEYESIVTRNKEVAWHIVRNNDVAVSDVYIREYNADGGICRYMSLEFFVTTVIHGKFSLSENITRDYEKMRLAYAEFLGERIRDLHWHERLLKHLRKQQ